MTAWQIQAMRDMTVPEALAFKKGFEMGMEFAFGRAAQVAPDLFDDTLELVRDMRARWEERNV